MSLLFRNPIKKKQYLLIAGDVSLIFCSIFLSDWIRIGLFQKESISSIVIEKLSWIVAVAIIVHILALYVFELYDLEKPFYFFKGLTKIGLAAGITFGLLSVLFYFIPAYKIGRVVLVTHIPFAISGLFIWRVLFWKMLKSPRQINRILLVGSDKSLDILMKELENYPVKAYHVAGIWEDNSNHSENEVVGIPVFNQGKLRDIVKVNQINTVVLSLHSPLSSELIKEALELKYNGVAVYDMPTFYKHLTGKVPIFHVDGSWLLFYSGIGAFGRSPYYEKLKRPLNILISALGLICVSPILIISAIAIKLNSKGPIFFIQKRVGLGGKEISLIKFRTMIQNSEFKTGAKWTMQTTSESSYALTQAGKNDTRITRVGRFLRKTRIDELPQLFNVLIGNLGLVGPRPVRKHFESQFAQEIPFYSLRHSVKPGITGWAQTRHHDARSEEGPLVRFQYDLFYIQESSLFLDLMILLKTIQTVLCKPSQ